MSQHTLSIANVAGATFRAQNNLALQASATEQSGATAPATTYPYQIWVDTTAGLIKRRDGANTSWVTIASISGSTIIPYRDGVALGDAAVATLAALSGVLGFKKGASKAAGATVDLASATGNLLHVTGAGGPIADFGTVQAGTAFLIVFDSTPTITYNATSMITQTLADLVIEAGDLAIVVSEGASNWRVYLFRASGKALSTSAAPSGAMVQWAGTSPGSAPTGWLVCDGQAVDRTTYAGLFAVTGTTYGVGDGSTTFNLPDMRGKAAIGVNDAGLPSGLDAGFTTRNEGDEGGAETHTLVAGELPAHSLTVPLSDSAGGSSNNVAKGTATNNGSINTSSIGSGTAHENMPPFVALNWLIKT